MNVNENTVNAIYILIKQCFEENRWLDRMVSVLGVNFVCNQSSNLIHHNIAHAYPKLSDKIGEMCLERYNIAVEYGETQEGKQNYASVSAMIQELENRSIDFQSMFMGVMKIAWDNNDLQIYSDLSDILSDYNFIVEQVILLNDKIQFYGENEIMKFDHDIDKFWILDENLF